jgi:hypothetical protein
MQFVRQLFDACRAHAPDCTVDEIVSAIEAKIQIKHGQTVDNWMGFFLTAVPRHFEGEAFHRSRASVAAESRSHQESPAGYQPDHWRSNLEHIAAALPDGYEEIASSLRDLTATANDDDVEGIQQRLIIVEEAMIATALARLSEEDALDAAREIERRLGPDRAKMITADQISALEAHYRAQDLLKRAGLPRLSLYYPR